MLFSCVLRRLLCFNTGTILLEDSRMDVRDSLEENVRGDKGNNPGLVARLMGLETIATTRKETTISSSSGTRSLNYSLSSEDMGESIVGKHLPSQLFSLEHEEDFIVISFEDKRERNDKVLFKSKAGRSRRKRFYENVKQRKPGIHPRNDLQNLDPNKVEESMGDNEPCLETIREGTIQESNGIFCPTLITKVSTERGMLLSSKSVDCDEILNRRKQVKALYSTKVEEQHCDIENSSPVSVLDIVQLYTDPRVAKSGSLIVGSLNSRRKLSTELEDYEELPPLKPVIDLEKRKIKSNAESRLDDLSSDNCSGMLGEICKMAQENVTELHWDYNLLSKLEDIKDISAQFELQIIGGLLDDLVEQLIDLLYD